MLFADNPTFLSVGQYFEEAIVIAKRLGEGGGASYFSASNGWLSKWKKTFNISEMHVAGRTATSAKKLSQARMNVPTN